MTGVAIVYPSKRHIAWQCSACQHVNASNADVLISLGGLNHGLKVWCASDRCGRLSLLMIPEPFRTVLLIMDDPPAAPALIEAKEKGK